MLWNTQVKVRQKLAIGTTLSLSVAMIITCIIQVSSIRTVTGTIDVTWEIFWQLAEACIAVLMVSLTALRSLFVGHGSRVRRSPGQSWSSRQAKKWLRRSPSRTPDRYSESDRLPKIPRATLTGMRTFIQGDRAYTAGSIMRSEYHAEGENGDDAWALPPLTGSQSRV